MSEFKDAVESSRVAKQKVTFGSDYLRITDEHQTVIRVLDNKPEIRWSHWIPPNHHAFPSSNAGKGISIVCPGWDACPICEWNKAQKAKDKDTKDLLRARKIYTFNVLDRTPVVNCASCSAEYYEIKGTGFPTSCACGENLPTESQPRNKIQILQKGIRLIDQLIAFEDEPDLGEITGYDIKIDTRGKGGEAMSTCIPKQKSKLDLKKVLGEGWEDKKYNVAQVMSPLDTEKISKILGGEGYYNVVGDKTVGDKGS